MSARRILTPADAGCFIDSHHGHYATPQMIELAAELGFHLDALERYALECYAEDSHAENYPSESLQELADEALEWLNGSEPSRRGLPPEIPPAHGWAWNDGDFGLYPLEDEEVSS